MRLTPRKRLFIELADEFNAVAAYVEELEQRAAVSGADISTGETSQQEAEAIANA